MPSETAVSSSLSLAAPALSMPEGKVLIVEDDSSVRIFLKRALEIAGHRVTAVEDADLALKVMAKNSFDVVVTDIVMPGMDGISLCQKISENWPQTKVVLVTGYPGERQRAEAHTAGIFAFLPKPFTLSDIQDCITAAIGKQKSLSA